MILPLGPPTNPDIKFPENFLKNLINPRILSLVNIPTIDKTLHNLKTFLSNLSTFSNLKDFNIYNCNIDPTTLSLSTLTNLQKLNISSWPNITDSRVHHLSSLTNPINFNYKINNTIEGHPDIVLNETGSYSYLMY